MNLLDNCYNMWYTKGNTVYGNMTRMYYVAGRDVQWDVNKYGSSKHGTSIPINYIKDKAYQTYHIIFPEDNKKITITRKKIVDYYLDTPQSAMIKNQTKSIVIPLSICEISSLIEKDIDVNSF